jgi:tetratricopeptide (TPR) repeat protein
MDGGEVEQAAALSAAALALGQRPVEALLVNATLALAQGDTAGAIAQFQEVLDTDPNEGRSRVGMGDASLMAHDYLAAKQQLERAVALMPGSIGGWASLGWCHVFSDDLASAGKAFQQAMQINRTFAETHGSIATVAAMRGDIVKAQAGIERVFRLGRRRWCWAARPPIRSVSMLWPCVSSVAARMHLVSNSWTWWTINWVVTSPLHLACPHGVHCRAYATVDALPSARMRSSILP